LPAWERVNRSLIVPFLKRGDWWEIWWNRVYEENFDFSNAAMDRGSPNINPIDRSVYYNIARSIPFVGTFADFGSVHQIDKIVCLPIRGILYVDFISSNYPVDCAIESDLLSLYFEIGLLS
jgi:hypothetical protein